MPVFRTVTADLTNQNRTHFNRKAAIIALFVIIVITKADFCSLRIEISLH